ncbi:uncharacterized protein LOC121915193 isoform X1 [Sceloporus undulatus]|uniref:uncharacterized protein LOC121915193 isoform X1 n=1 Tax=Sceloporus undulatus TaxID=8520 RepID=UPI001C4AF2D2|nr:uncharacterized protein LOC121915193 isoform X1 [Sceloporus undulatus]
MGKVKDTVILSQMSGEHLPLLGQAAPIATYLSQDEVVQQAGAARWVCLRRATFGLLGVLFACLLIMAVLLLLTMPRPRPPLAWWQKASFYHLPAASFPDSNGDGHGDLGGVRHQLDHLLERSIQALVLGSILEGHNLSHILPAHGSLGHLQALVNDAHKRESNAVLGHPRCAWIHGEEGASLAHGDGKEMALRHTPREHIPLPKSSCYQEYLPNVEVESYARLINPECVSLILLHPDSDLQVLDVWSELDSEVVAAPSRGEERVLMVWDESETCNISRRVPSGSVILTCYLLKDGANLTAQAVAQQVERVLGYPGAPWPSWTVPRGLLEAPDLGEMLGVLLLTLPGAPFLPGGKGSPIQPERDPTKGSTNGHPLAGLYHSLLALHANTYPLRGIDFVLLPLVDPSKDVFAFLRLGSCASILVVLNLGSQPFQLSLKQLGIPGPAKVLFSTRPVPQREVDAEGVQFTPHQAILLKVPRGHGP